MLYCFSVERIPLHIQWVLGIGILGIFLSVELVLHGQFLSLGCKLCRNGAPALFRPYSTAPAIVNIHHRIVFCQFLAIDAGGILFAGDRLAPEGLGGHTIAVPLTPCGCHKEIVLADLALPGIMAVVETFKEVRNDEAVVAVKE